MSFDMCASGRAAEKMLSPLCTPWWWCFFRCFSLS